MPLPSLLLDDAGDPVALGEQQFASVFDHAAIGMALCTPQGRFIKVNPALCHMLGYSKTEMLACSYQELTHPDDLNDSGLMHRLLAGEIPSFHREKRFHHRLGHTVWVLLTVSSMRGAAGQPLHQIAQLQDITERKAHEIEIARLTRLYAALSHINQAIVRINGRDTLLQKVCESLVMAGGFTAAWIDTHATQLQVPVRVASFGDDPGPAQACAAFPIRQTDGTCYTLGVHADAAHVLQDKEVALLSEVAADVSFALDNMARNAESQRAKSMHQASEARLVAAQALAHMGSWELDLPTLQATYSVEMLRLLYWDPARGAPTFAEFCELAHPDDRHLIAQAIAQTAHAMAPYTLDYRTHPDLGPVRHLSATIHVIRNSMGQPLITQATTLDVTARKSADAVLARMKAIVDSSDDAIISKDLYGVIESWNAGAESIFGYRADEIIGSPILRLIPAHRAAEEEHILSTIRQGGRVKHFETVRVRKDGSLIDISVTTSPIQNAEGVIIGASKVARDITDRKHAQMALQASLQEKEALLKEVHHRVKNNLQVINSLLRLETGRSAQPDTRTVLRDMQGRIRAMALLHESLYRTGIFAAVDLGAYLRQMANQAFRSQAPSGGASIALELALEPVQVGMDQATPCGLLVNELISNCFKHAFPMGQGGTVRVELQLLAGSGQVQVRVSDSGVGLPDDFEVRKAQSLGLQLVSDLAQQLKGALQVGPGPSFTVVFPLDSA